MTLLETADVRRRTSNATYTQLGHCLGAVVSGVDVRTINAETASDIYAALLEHKVLVFHGQHIEPEHHAQLANLFGIATPAHPVMPGLSDDFPQIWQIDSTQDGARNDIWHTDVTFVERPPLGSILRAVQVPPFGGDTSWASLDAAYDSLPPALAAFAESLVAVHDGAGEFADVITRQGAGNQWEGSRYDQLKTVTHPVVRVHPETGRKALFVNPGFTTQIVGFEPADSRRILDLFFDHIARPEHTIRHHWSPGDIVIWDNRNTVHYANDDVVDFRRVMHRITIEGDVPVGV